MKRIIDISEDVYEWLKLGYVDINDKANLVTIVKSSIPLEECEDCVSRQAVMEHYSTGEIVNCHHISRNNLLDFIEQLPSVTPQPKIAHVISDEDGNIKCSSCGSHDCWGNYCSECGANMQEVEG